MESRLNKSNCIVASQWYGEDKKDTEIGAKRIAELFNKEGKTELIKLQIPEATNEDDKLMLCA